MKSYVCVCVCAKADKAESRATIRTGEGLEGQRVVSVARTGSQVGRLAILLENTLVPLQFTEIINHLFISPATPLVYQIRDKLM